MDCSLPSILQASTCSSASGITGSTLMLLFNTLANATCKFLKPNDFAPDIAASLTDGDTFDFIVIGAGSAGAVVSTRLVEANAGWRVLLLEAGTYPVIDNEVPAFFNYLQGTSQDWAYRTEPEMYACQGLKDHSSRWPRGKVLGGTSQMNAMLYVRGNPNDYDEWALMGNNGWAYKDVLPYFLKAERFEGEDDGQDQQVHGTDGPLVITRYPSHSEWMRTLRNASRVLEGKDLGLDKNMYGLYQSPTTIGSNGRRASTARCYLTRPQVKARLNMALGVEAIQIMRNRRRATGVQVRMPDGRILILNANRELIVSAGAINSPKLLMESGIDLSGIGQNLQDHFTTFNLMLVAKPGPKPLSSLADQLYMYLMDNTGPLATTGLSNAMWFTHSDRAVRQDPNSRARNKPNLQILFMEFPQGDTANLLVFANAMGVNDATMRSMAEQVLHKQVLFVGITLLYPESVGYVTMDQSTGKLRIVANYLSDANGRDIEMLLGGVEYVGEMLKTPGMRSINATWANIDVGPKCGQLKFASIPYFECFIRHFATTIYHPVGTCKMGPDSSNVGGAVVDDQLRVWGVENLRVIDASVMPRIIGGNTNVPTIMIGEKGADMIIDAHTRS